MKKFLIFLIAIWFAIWLGLKVAADPGYLLMAYGHWTVEMPLWLGGLFVIVLTGIVFLLLDLIRCSFGIPERFRFWSAKRMVKWARKMTHQGLVALAEGYWPKAEKYLNKAALESQDSLIHYLACAYAAQAQGFEQRRDDYLKKAYEHNPDAAIAIGLTQAQLQMGHHQLEQALATLRHLHELVPKHQYVLLLLKKLYLKLKDWQSLQKLQPFIKKSRVLNELEYIKLEKQIYIERFQQEQHHDEETRQLWLSLSSSFKKDPDILLSYCSNLIHQGALEEAENYLRRFLRKHYHDKLVLLYGSFIFNEGFKQLAFLDYLSKTYPEHAEIYYSLSRIYQSQKSWIKVKNALENAVRLKPESRYLLDLAEWNEKHKNLSAAISLYRQAATLAQGK